MIYATVDASDQPSCVASLSASHSASLPYVMPQTSTLYPPPLHNVEQGNIHPARHPSGRQQHSYDNQSEATGV